MSKLLIFIGEKKKFDVNSAISAITSLSGVSNARRGNFIGALFECVYSHDGQSTIVRISPEGETITVEGLGDDALSFALELQRMLPENLVAIDMEYSFNISLRNFNSVPELKRAMTA